MTWVHCAECPNYQECAEADGCENERKKAEAAAAAERRTILAGVDRGITDIIARFTRFISMADVKNEEVELLIVAPSERDVAMIVAAFKHDVRNHDLFATYPGMQGEPDLREGIKFMGLKVRVVKDPRRGQ